MTTKLKAEAAGTKVLFVLGADSQAMRDIEQLLTDCGVPFAHAVKQNGERIASSC